MLHTIWLPFCTSFLWNRSGFSFFTLHLFFHTGKPPFYQKKKPFIKRRKRRRSTRGTREQDEQEQEEREEEQKEQEQKRTKTRKNIVRDDKNNHSRDRETETLLFFVR
jgi:hypothetical protein